MGNKVSLFMKSLRKNKKLTQREVAEFLNISRSTYNAYEQEISEPGIDTLIKLADFYRTSIDFLVGRETKQINLLALPTQKREMIEVILELNLVDTAKLHAYVSGFADRVDYKPPPLRRNEADYKF